MTTSTPRLSDDARRLALVVIPEAIVLEWFRRAAGKAPAFIRLPFADLPDGTEVLSVHHDYSLRSFAFTVRHPSLAVVPDGTRLPELDPIALNTEVVPVRDLAAEKAAGLDYHAWLQVGLRHKETARLDAAVPPAADCGCGSLVPSKIEVVVGSVLDCGSKVISADNSLHVLVDVDALDRRPSHALVLESRQCFAEGCDKPATRTLATCGNAHPGEVHACADHSLLANFKGKR